VEENYVSHTEEVEGCMLNCSFLILESCVKTAYNKLLVENRNENLCRIRWNFERVPVPK
jgi:hypothetical protein